MKDAEIDYSDIPPLGDEFFTKATVPWPPGKQQLTIRLDADVVKWLKGSGRGYQTRINRILRMAMENQPSQAAAAPPRKRTKAERSSSVRQRQGTLTRRIM